LLGSALASPNRFVMSLRRSFAVSLAAALVAALVAAPLPAQPRVSKDAPVRAATTRR
jgi:hypothetical protein